MSLLGTLAKVAIGVAVAKGVSGMAGAKRSTRPVTRTNTGTSAGRSTGGAGSGSIFGDMFSPGGSGSQGGGGLGEILSGKSGSGGLGDLGGLGQILSGKSGSGGLGDLGGLGQILAGRAGSGSGSGSGSAGGLGGLLDSLSQASRPKGEINVAPPTGGSLGDLLNQSLERFGEPETPPAQEHEDAARVMLRAMLQAAKSDGRIDAQEKEKLLGQLGDISREDMDFINAELAKPVDVKALARDVPFGMGEQVYSMTLLAIDLDSQKEAAFLNELAQELGIDPNDANAIHDKMGEPRIYS